MSETATPSTVSEAERNQARKEAVVELGKGIALGLLPVVGQAIDAYDTIESAIALHGSREGEDKETAQFDFILALIGWIPGPGDGVKKSLRIVNRDPQRFAPVLFDLLRFVLQECGIKTSPEALLDEIFNAGKLRSQIDEIERGVVDSTVFSKLPKVMQDVVKGTLKTARQNLPALIGVVQKRLIRWKKLQPNSSSRAVTQGRARGSPPKARDGSVSANGQARAEHGHANTSTHGTLATQTLKNIANEAVGISGEHIADYICLETFGWGSGWHAHDEGTSGHWSGGTPDAERPGKLSAGGSPKQHHKLYKLTDGANGTGIDAVWRANSRNSGKPYAIVEAKATKDEDAPKFMRRVNNTRKPSITSKLGVSGITDPSELLEPLEDDATAAPSKTGGGKKGGTAGGKAGGKRSTPMANGSSSVAPSAASKKAVLVQMSHEWIEENIARAVLDRTALRDFKRLRSAVYSRHLFFSPAYHPSGSPAAHMRARLQGLQSEQHAKHDAFHYGEDEVRKAVNKRKTSLRRRYGNTASLKNEA